MLHEAQVNVVEGSGADLPCLLGLDSMTRNNCVILLQEGKEMLCFPGDKGYFIEWSPGSHLLPLSKAPSGHLVVPCDRFADLNGAQPDISRTFYTDHRRPHGVETPSGTEHHGSVAASAS